MDQVMTLDWNYELSTKNRLISDFTTDPGLTFVCRLAVVGVLLPVTTKDIDSDTVLIRWMHSSVVGSLGVDGFMVPRDTSIAEVVDKIVAIELARRIIDA